MSPIPFYDDPMQWRWRAEEMRVLADSTDAPETKAIMVRIADDCERLAQHAEARARGQGLKS